MGGEGRGGGRGVFGKDAGGTIRSELVFPANNLVREGREDGRGGEGRGEGCVWEGRWGNHQERACLPCQQPGEGGEGMMMLYSVCVCVCAALS